MKIAVCICTYDRSALLKKLLETLATVELDIPDAQSVEVVVVDNHPDGQARAVFEETRSNLPVAARFIEEQQRGISYARNAALREALGHGADFVAFIDDDDYPEPDWLLRLIEKQRESGADLVWGVWRTIVEEDLPNWVKNSWLVKTPAESLHRTNFFGIPVMAGTLNVLIGRSLLERMDAHGPWFSLDFTTFGGGDIDFFIRARKAGASFAQAERSVINRGLERDRLTVRGMLKRNFRRGNAAMYLARKHCGPEEIKSMRSAAKKNFRENLKQLLKRIHSTDNVLRRSFQISRALGCLYGSVGGKYNYYK